MWTPELIEDLLHSKEFKAFMAKKIQETVGKHERIKNPRIEFSKNSRTFDRYEGVNPFKHKQQKGFISEETFQLYKQDSVLAGGAIAAWVYEYLFFVPAVINDVDLFTYKYEGRSKIEVASEIYSNLNTEDFDFQILNNQNKGLLNQIDLFPEYEFSWNQLLNSFDLNCSEVGWNLSHGSLFYSQNFMNFLLTREIKVDSKDDEFYLTSYIRAAMKKNEMQAKYYQNDALRAYVLEKFYELFKSNPLSKTIKLVKSKDDAGDEETEFISAKRIKVWRQNPELLSPYLKVNPTRRSFTVGDVQLQPWFQFIRRLAWIYQERSHNHNFEDIFRYFNRSNNSKKINLFTENSATLNRLIVLLENSNIFESYTSWIQVFEKRDSFLRKSFNEEKFKNVAIFLNSHSRLKNINLQLVLNGWEVSDLITWYEMLEKQPLFILGLLESIDDKINYYFHNDVASRTNEYGEYFPVDELIDTELLDFTHAAITKNFSKMIKTLEKIREKTKDLNLLVQPLSIAPFNKYVVELVESTELEKEGSFMHHCVGGYSSAIKKGQCRIFSIRTGDKERSTLEIRFMKENSIFISVQHKTFNNRFPIDKHVKIAELFLNYLNSYILFMPTARSEEQKNQPQTPPIKRIKKTA